MALRPVVRVLAGQETSEGAGVRLKRMIGTPALDHLDSFLLLDEFVVVTTDSPGRLLLLAARPLREPVARYGPFVMNTREEIMQAVQDLQNATVLD